MIIIINVQFYIILLLILPMWHDNHIVLNHKKTAKYKEILFYVIS